MTHRAAGGGGVGGAHGSMMARISVPHYSPQNHASMPPGIGKELLKPLLRTVSSENLPNKSGPFSLIFEARNHKKSQGVN